MTTEELKEAFKGIDYYSMSEQDLEEFFGILLVEETKVRTVIKTRIYAKNHYIPKSNDKD